MVQFRVLEYFFSLSGHFTYTIGVTQSGTLLRYWFDEIYSWANINRKCNTFLYSFDMMSDFPGHSVKATTMGRNGNFHTSCLNTHIIGGLMGISGGPRYDIPIPVLYCDGLPY